MRIQDVVSFFMVCLGQCLAQNSSNAAKAANKSIVQANDQEEIDWPVWGPMTGLIAGLVILCVVMLVFMFNESARRACHCDDDTSELEESYDPDSDSDPDPDPDPIPVAVQVDAQANDGELVGVFYETGDDEEGVDYSDLPVAIASPTP